MKVAVIGTGTLGPAIAQVFAECGRIETVYLCRGRDLATGNGKDKIERAYDKLIRSGKLSREQADAYLDKIVTGPKENAARAELLVEAVSENLEIKRKVFRELDAICGERCLFTTNTSSLPINEIGDGLSRPLIGMHFFNPAPVMKLVEVVATEDTPREMIDTVMQVAADLGKSPIEIKEAPGFVVNRVLIPMINEAISIYAEGVASIDDIDTAMRLGANQPMGPLALGDLIGLDVVLSILNVMLKDTGDPKYVPQPMLKKMVREKKLGRKTGEGFYKY